MPAWPEARIRSSCRAKPCSRPAFRSFKDQTMMFVWTSDSLMAGVLHLGSRPQTGHCRTFLAYPRTAPAVPPQVMGTSSTDRNLTPAGDQGISASIGRPSPSAPSGSPAYTWWCTDDGKPAEVCHPTYLRTLVKTAISCVSNLMQICDCVPRYAGLLQCAHHVTAESKAFDAAARLQTFC